MVEVEKLDHKSIKRLLVLLKYTKSKIAFIIDDFENQCNGFIKVYPKELRIIDNKKNLQQIHKPGF